VPIDMTGRLRRRTKEIGVRHHFHHLEEHHQLVVDKMGDAELPADGRLVDAPTTETDVRFVDSGALVELMMYEPLARLLLHKRTALGNNEYVLPKTFIYEQA